MAVKLYLRVHDMKTLIKTFLNFLKLGLDGEETLVDWHKVFGLPYDFIIKGIHRELPTDCHIAGAYRKFPGYSHKVLKAGAKVGFFWIKTWSSPTEKRPILVPAKASANIACNWQCQSAKDLKKKF